MKEEHIFDLLINGPNSFACMWLELIKHWGYDEKLSVEDLHDKLSAMWDRGLVTEDFSPMSHDVRLSTEDLRDMLHAMRDRGLVTEDFSPPRDHKPAVEVRKDESALEAYKRWLVYPMSLDDVSVDPVGLWYEVTSKGRAAWRLHFGEDESREKWNVTTSFERRSVTILAETEAMARRLQGEFFDSEPNFVQLAGTERIKSGLTYTLRDETVVRNGVELSFRYEIPGGVNPMDPFLGSRTPHL